MMSPRLLSRGSRAERLAGSCCFLRSFYVFEGLGQTGELIAQPHIFFLKQVYGGTPVQVTA
jgi:hypothetical protein